MGNRKSLYQLYCIDNFHVDYPAFKSVYLKTFSRTPEQKYKPQARPSIDPSRVIIIFILDTKKREVKMEFVNITDLRIKSK